MDEYRMPEGHAYFEIASRFADLYVSYRQRFVMMREGMSYVPKHNGHDVPLSNSIICGHLNRKYAICVYAGSLSSKFICFDVDDGNKDTVRKIIDTLTDLGFERNKIYVSTSGGKGYHVEIFFDGLMYTDRLKILYTYVCNKNDLDTRKVEFRPTAGQSIKLPLSVHRKTGNVCWYLDRETFVPIETQDYVMQIQRVGVEPANEIIKSIKHLPLALPNYDRGDDPVMEISDKERDEICGDRYPDIKQDGERHNLMIQIAVHNRYRGLSPAACKDELVHWYRRQNQSLIKENEKSVMNDIDQMIRWAYGEKFQVAKRENIATFASSDFKMLAAQPSQGRRKVMFYVLLCVKRYGHATASAQKMADELGLSRQGVIKALRLLEAEKWLMPKKNRCVTKPDGIIRLPNTYFLSDRACGWAEGYMFTSMPALDREREQMARSFTFGEKTIVVPDHLSTADAYSLVMRAAFTKDELKEIMTLKEYQQLEEYEDE